MERFSKAATIIGFSTAIVSCGDSGTGSSYLDDGSAHTWRLKYSEAAPYMSGHYSDAFFYASDYAMHYDSSNEISRADEYSLAELLIRGWDFNTGEIIPLTKEQFDENESNAFLAYVEIGIDSPCIEEGDLIGQESINNTSPDAWTIKYTWPFNDSPSQIDGEDCNYPERYDQSLDLIDWGDIAYLWNNTPDDWSDAASTHTGSTDMSTNLETTAAFIDAGASLITQAETDRTYNQKNQLTHITYSEDSAHTREVTLFWSEYRLQTISIDSITKDLEIDTPEGPKTVAYGYPHIEYRYNYDLLSDGIVTVDVWGEFQGELSLIITLQATYEQADCGPMTLERSKKYVPHPFPVCFER